MVSKFNNPQKKIERKERAGEMDVFSEKTVNSIEPEDPVHTVTSNTFMQRTFNPHKKINEQRIMYD